MQDYNLWKVEMILPAPKLKAGKEGYLGARSSLSLGCSGSWKQIAWGRLRPESRALCRSPAQQLSQFQLAPCNRVRYEWDNACGSKFKIILCTWHFYMLPYIYISYAYKLWTNRIRIYGDIKYKLFIISYYLGSYESIQNNSYVVRTVRAIHDPCDSKFIDQQEFTYDLSLVGGFNPSEKY